VCSVGKRRLKPGEGVVGNVATHQAGSPFNSCGHEGPCPDKARANSRKWGRLGVLICSGGESTKTMLREKRGPKLIPKQRGNPRWRQGANGGKGEKALRAPREGRENASQRSFWGHMTPPPPRSLKKQKNQKITVPKKVRRSRQPL